MMTCKQAERRGLALVMATVVVGAFVVLMMASCAQLAPVRDRIVSGVESYCKTALAERQLLRASVNESLARVGASVKVSCPGDPD